jgi:aspartate kinase
MKVFKFGGASVKDANAVKNVAAILSLFEGEKITIVVSAMGKTTNKLEELVFALKQEDKKAFFNAVDDLQSFHQDILGELFPTGHFTLQNTIDGIFEQLKERINRSVAENYAFEYDQIVSIGEVLSSHILSQFLIEKGFQAKWMDARTLVRTDNSYQEGGVDWKKTEQLIQTRFIPQFEYSDLLVTQGFVGHTPEGFTTTLGREGSDYTAAIFAFCGNADSVTIWKDVPGMLNADPKYFSDTIKLDSISFREALELSYYGASVIHPKTIKPLQNKGIPLYVKSFVDPHAEGTTIQESTANDTLIPSFIFKMNQVLVSFSPKDFSFIVEENLSDIFNKLAKLRLKINVMQNSALNFSVAIDGSKVDINELIAEFSNAYNVKYNQGLELITIRHYDDATIKRTTLNKTIILEQRTRQTARFLVKDNG